ncbi:hypothetical protein Vretifemale_3974, partial [Volvox reticuliferus]
CSCRTVPLLLYHASLFLSSARVAPTITLSRTTPRPLVVCGCAERYGTIVRYDSTVRRYGTAARYDGTALSYGTATRYDGTALSYVDAGSDTALMTSAVVRGHCGAIRH